MVRKNERTDSSVVVSKFSNMAKIYPDFSSSFNSALQEKLTYIDLKGINGIALWCVGYDQNNEEVFNTLIDFIRDNEMNMEESFVPAINQMIEQNNIDIVSLQRAPGICRTYLDI